MKRKFVIAMITLAAVMTFFSMSILTSCSSGQKMKIEDGVPFELAQARKSSVSGLHYNVFMRIPSEKDRPVTGELEISFRLDGERYASCYEDFLYIDYKEDPARIHRMELNGKEIQPEITQEHIALPLAAISDSLNVVRFELDYGDSSLNRNEDFLYTLLVPDRARTLMPCFDQPDLKGRFTVEMTVPGEWEALTNSPLQSETSAEVDGRPFRRLRFGTSEPLSTYLFSVVAGKFFVSAHEQDGRAIHIYHRETDPHAAGQMDEIAGQVFKALKWMEDYTGIPYPFVKYDLALIPGFQFGGMEHTGATLYHAGAMILPENATLQHEIRRATLIAHETAHMWFGDYVTMEWFNEVWVKEVFANYFANQMIRPLYPQIDFKMNDLTFYTSAYREDRTEGTTPIQQELPNLKYAGLVYGNIIYQKSPIVMDMLCRKMGAENFRKGMQDYLKSYPYGNASYDDLIAALERNNDGKSLKAWSDYWVYGKGMPRVDLADSISAEQVQQAAAVSFQTLRIDTLDQHPVPNADAEYYGYVSMQKEDMDYMMEHIDDISERISGETSLAAALVRKSIHMTLYENWLNGKLPDPDYLDFLCRTLTSEADPQVFPLIPSAIRELVVFTRDSQDSAMLRKQAEQALWQYFSDNGRFAAQVMTYLLPIVSERDIVAGLYDIWKHRSSSLLGERDYIAMSFYLAINLPEKDDEILSEQYSRLENPDRRAEYAFISPAAYSGTEKLDSIFQSLTSVQNRAKEPWVRSVLLLMNHIDRLDYTVKYIEPALGLLPEIQRTGDIFFPKNWVEALLMNHASDASQRIVDDFIEDNDDMLQLMKNKILQSKCPRK